MLTRQLASSKFSSSCLCRTYILSFPHRELCTLLIRSVIANIVSIITAFVGSYVSDRAGRRRSLIFGSLALALAYGAAMVASSQTGVSSYVDEEPAPNPSASIAGIAFLIVAQGVYGWAIATNVWTYPTEVLSTRQRTTALSLAGLVTKTSCEYTACS